MAYAKLLPLLSPWMAQGMPQWLIRPQLWFSLYDGIRGFFY